MKLLMKYLTFFVLSFCSPLCVLYLQHISIGTSYILSTVKSPVASDCRGGPKSRRLK